MLGTETRSQRRQALRGRARKTGSAPEAAVRPGGPLARSDHVALLGVLAVTALTFLPVVRHQFTNWDDPQNVAGNPLVMDPSWSGLVQVWTKPLNSMYAPLVFTSYMIDSLAGGGAPWVFHATNLLLHLGSAAVAFFILRRLAPDAPSWACGAGALLFAVHPLQAEPVAWVTGRKDVLAGCLALTAVALHLGADHAPAPARRKVLSVAAAAAFTLALLAKATVAALPPAVLAIQVLLIRQPVRPCLVRLIPWFLAAGLMALVAMAAEPKPQWLAEAVPLGKRPLLAGSALAFYAGKVLFPWPLAPVYPVNAPEAAANPWSAAALLGCLVAGAAAAFRKGRPAALLILFVSPLLPVLGLIPFLYQQISMTADRYAYLSLLAPALGAVMLADDARMLRPAPRNTVYAALAAVLLLCPLLAHRQARLWRDSETLWSHAVRVSPGVPEAHTNLAFALHHRGALDEAEWQLELAVRADRDFSEAWNLLGLLRLQRQGPAAALPALSETVRSLEKKGHGGKRLADAYNNLGVAHQQRGDHTAAEQAFRRSLEHAPSGEGWANLAETLEALGRRGEARQARMKAAGRGFPVTAGQ